MYVYNNVHTLTHSLRVAQVKTISSQWKCFCSADYKPLLQHRPYHKPYHRLQ